jgi:hypothetical protein
MGFIPQLFIKLVFVFTYLFLVVAIVKYFPQVTSSDQRFRVFIPIIFFIILLGEALQRHIPFLSFLYGLYFRGTALLRRVIVYLRSQRRIYLFIFLAIIIVFSLVEGPLIFKGLQDPLNSTPERGKEMIVLIVSITSGFVAVFFTAASFVIQLIAGSYSYKFAQIPLRNFVFLGSLVLLLTITGANFWLLWNGWNELLFEASFYSAVFVILIFFVSTLMMIQFFSNIPALAQLEAERIINSINRSLPKRKKGYRDLRTDKKSKSFVEVVDIALKLNLVGRISYSNYYSLPISVPEEFSNNLAEEVRHFFSACNRAIKEDRRDIAIACLTQIENIAGGYFKARVKYAGMSDDFSMFLHMQLEALYDQALPHINQQYTSDLVRTAGVIAEHSLILSGSQFREDQNSVAGGWADLLASFAIRAIPLQRTNAPTTATSRIGSLARSLILQGVSTTSIFGVLRALSRVGIVSANKGGAWALVICSIALSGQVKAIYAVLDSLSRMHFNQYAIGEISKYILKIAEVAWTRPLGYSDSLPLVTSLVSSLEIHADLKNVVNYAFQRIRSTTDLHARARLLLSLEALPTLIVDIVEIVNGKSSHAIHEFGEALSRMAWDTLLFFDMGTLSDEERKILKKLILNIVQNARHILSISPQDEYHDIYEAVFPVYAFMFHFAYNKRNEPVRELLLNSIDSIMQDFVNLGGKDSSDRISKHVPYKYMKMIGAWLYRFDREEHCLKKLVKVLKENIGNEDIDFYAGGIERLGYPGSMFSNRWTVPIFSNDANFNIERDLHDDATYREFNKLVND